MQRNVSTCVKSGLEIFYFLWPLRESPCDAKAVIEDCWAHFRAIHFLWHEPCDERGWSSLQKKNILYLSPEGLQLRSTGKGPAEDAFAGCPTHMVIASSNSAGAQDPVLQISGVQEVLGKDELWAWKGKNTLIFCKCQTPKLVEISMSPFTSLKWGDLCLLKNRPWSPDLLWHSSRAKKCGLLVRPPFRP